MSQLFQLPKPVAIDSNLNLMSGAKLFFYQTGTTTLQNAYQDADLVTAHANPVVADSAGVFPPIWFDSTLPRYKCVFKTSADVEVYTVDPVNQFLPSQAEIGQTLYPRTAAEVSAGVTPTNYFIPPYNVMRYNAKGDRTTDDLAAFNTAAAVAVYSKRIFIPALRAGYYYKLSGAWALTNLDSVQVYGEGVQSLIVIANNAGANAITVDSTVHATLTNFGIYGTSGSGNGIELINDSHHNVLSNIWCGWVDGDAFKNTLGISTTYINCRADQNNGYRPATLQGGLTDGSIKRGFYVPSTATGRNNNPTFVGCQVNAAGATMSVQIGDNAGTPIESFNWHGGLIQGSAVHQEVYLVTRSSIINGAHIEPPVGVSANWVVTFDACTNTWIKNCGVQGDARLINSCQESGFRDVVGYGMDISADSVLCGWKGGIYRNNNTGPAGGDIRDRAVSSIIENMLNASNGRFVAGRRAREGASTYLETIMEDWVGTSVPCGFSSFGSPTITRESSVIRSGTYSVKVVHDSELNEGFQIHLAPNNALIGRYITIEAWVRNVSTAGLAYISMLEGGTGSATYQPSFTADQWERMLVSFKPDVAATSVAIRFTGLIGTVYWDSIKITVEEFAPRKEMTLDGTATPSISYGGRPVPLLVTSGTPTITNFLNPHVGVPFTIRFAGATVITDGDPIFLNGSGNFTGAAGDTMTLVYGSDGKFRELSRSVV